MSRPLDRRQSLENQAFLRELARTGNAREAPRSTMRAAFPMDSNRRRPRCLRSIR